MFEQLGDEILRVEDVTTKNQIAIIKSHFCLAKKLAVEGPESAIVNNAVSITAKYQDWQNNPLSDENCPIHITVTGPGQAQELVLTPTNGQAEFDFVSEVPSTFIIRATAEFPCGPAEIEVVVS